METIWENDQGGRMPELLPESIKKDEFNSSSSSSSSSIGVDSDLDQEDEDEVQSSRFNAALQALEQALPIRRGISNYYNGKSKSFTSFTDVTSSIQDIAKPENAYTRKRRILIRFALFRMKNKKLSKKPKTTPTFTRHTTAVLHGSR